MSEPIIIKEREAVEYRDVEEVWSYERLLDLYNGDDNHAIPQLVKRCQRYEEQIEKLNKEKQDLVATLKNQKEPEINPEILEIFTKYGLKIILENLIKWTYPDNLDLNGLEHTNLNIQKAYEIYENRYNEK